MKTLLIEYLGKSLLFNTTVPIEYFSFLYEKVQEVEHQNTIPNFLAHNPNNQEIRIFVNKYMIIKYQDFITLHGICFQDRYGKIVVLGGKTGAGKSYLFKKLKEEGLVVQLFDEDLCNISVNKKMFPLADKSFFGKTNTGEYLYQKNSSSHRGKVDGIFLLDEDFLAFQKTNLTTTTLINTYLLHESYKKWEKYAEFLCQLPSIPTYLIPNPHNGNNAALSFISTTLRGKKSL